ncbi:Glutamine-dependent NAD+ synthetase [Hondaea fermentalgiana]|uniref:Glutamine-dependent NAD(+) synthetase n=1 Tax=Hondaea fermentalgiana TaxID=2315210 RepID=A0A2R5G4I4_9STRA|nr:Glutamine-dependent NAD+ synthetase [Hondaea fermentalgiana]|eukprot:GBG25937.1 Glutamine-dependent NAD+ synthetase [Hondaea fermentalgiana]
MQNVTVATCSLDQWALDFDGNLERTKRSIELAKQKGATYRVGPELELSGYGCEDHFHEIDTFQHSAEALADILKSGLTDGILCDIGLPMLHNSVPYNCRAMCLNGKVVCIRPKLFLADDGNYREPRWFTRWERLGEAEDHYLSPALAAATGQQSCLFGDCSIQTLDTRVASETCEELFTPNSPHIHLGLSGVEILGNGSGSHFELRKLDKRIDLIRSATEKSGGVYLYANQLGCDGGRMLYDGCALIAVNGNIVAQGSQFSLADVEVITAVIDLEEIRAYRIAKASRGVQASRTRPIPVVHANFRLVDAKSCDPVSAPLSVRYHLPEEQIAYGPAVWLWDYARRTGASGFFLPLSGGADSSSTAAIVGAMCQMVAKAALNGDERVIADARRMAGQGPDYLPTDPREFANCIMHTAYLGTENSSQGTENFAKGLAEAIGNYHLTVKIDGVVSAILTLFRAVFGGREPRFKVHGGSFSENQALQNIQARSRMLLSYLFGQLLPWVRGNSGFLLVLGSGNVDEGLRGYLTKYDCSSADLNPIGGISKVDLKRFLWWAAKPETEGGLGFGILQAISEAPPTAELEPITDAYTQTDEADMGMTYQELSTFGRLRKISRCGPVSMFKRLLTQWDHLEPAEVASKVKHFFRSYAMNRHKMSTITPSVHCESYGCDDNRFDLRPIFIDARFPFQFRMIDRICAAQSSPKL